MFLSRLMLNARHSQVRKDLSNVYELHRTLTKVWADAPHSLYRVENDVILAQTVSVPNWSILPEGYLRRAAESRELGVEGHVKSNQPIRFRLRGNPSVARLAGHRERDGKRQTRRHPLMQLEDQLAWLSRQGERCGFGVVGAMVSESGFLPIRKASQEISVFQATFDGHLRVVDATLFLDALRTGVGHGKAWGLGLLSL